MSGRCLEVLSMARARTLISDPVRLPCASIVAHAKAPPFHFPRAPSFKATSHTSLFPFVVLFPLWAPRQGEGHTQSFARVAS